MCMNDWRIGRLIRTVSSPADFNGGGSVAIQANNQRVALSISLADAAVIDTTALSGANPSVKIARGGVFITSINAFASTYRVDLLRDGDASTLPHIVTNVDYGQSFSITEWLLPEQVLTSAIQQFYAENPKWPR